MEQYRVNRVWVDDAHIWAETQNGWKANYPFSRWNRLANATPAQRKAFVLSRYGIHWPELDEDLCFEGLFQMLVYTNRQMQKILFITKHNKSFFCRRISESLN